MIACAGDLDLSKLAAAVQLHAEDHVHDFVSRVRRQLGSNLRFEVTLLAKKLEQLLLSLFHIARVIGRLGRIIGDLNQSGVGESLRAGELEDAKVNRRLQDQQHANAIGLGLDLQLDLLEFPAALHGGYCLIYLLKRERLPRLLYKLRRELAVRQIGLSGDLDRGDVLSFVRGEKLRCLG